MDLVTFQLHLLSRMRATSKVDDALQRLSASRQDAARADEEAERLGFYEPIHAAQLYREVLGVPFRCEPERSIGPDSPFAGSTILRFRLPLWPEFDFLVREHPTGYAWGRGFDRTENTKAPPLRSVADLSPWAFVEAEVTTCLGQPNREDAWSGWEDLSYMIAESEGASRRRYLLGFDLNLLQTISLME